MGKCLVYISEFWLKAYSCENGLPLMFTRFQLTQPVFSSLISMKDSYRNAIHNHKDKDILTYVVQQDSFKDVFYVVNLIYTTDKARKPVFTRVIQMYFLTNECF